ncbi:MAG: glycerophosphodiester phosphodiesterase family protein [Bacteroidota bacterium]
MRKNISKDGKPLILAHRGLVTAFQENTMASIKAALDSPHCHGAEFDVFLTKDKKVVLFHDENLKRLTGIDRNIHDMTWDDLKTITVLKDIEVDGGLRHYPKEERIPLLSEVLEEVKGKEFFMDVELKAYSPKWSKRDTGTETAKIIRSLEMEDQLVCTSFDFFMLYTLEKEHPKINSGFAYDDDMPISAKWLNKLMEFNLIGRFVNSNLSCVEYTLIDEDTVKKYHSRDMAIGTFTLFPLTPSDKAHEKYEHYAREVKRLAALGVDWIETDDPEKAYALVYE